MNEEHTSKMKNLIMLQLQNNQLSTRQLFFTKTTVQKFDVRTVNIHQVYLHSD